MAEENLPGPGLAISDKGASSASCLQESSVWIFGGLFRFMPDPITRLALPKFLAVRLGRATTELSALN